MAARLRTKLYTFGSSPASISTIFSLPTDYFFSSLTLRADKSNAANVTWRDASGGDDGGYLEAREAMTMDVTGKFVSASQVFLSGTSGDKVYITVIG